MPRPPRTDIDWHAIQGEYLAGTKSVMAIAAEYGLSEANIRRRAKQEGWLRDATGTKRGVVKTALAVGAKQVTANINAGAVTTALLDEANQDINDMRAGLRIARNVLGNLERATAFDMEPKDCKIVIEATAKAIETIRTIRGLDDEGKAAGAFSDRESEALAETALAKIRGARGRLTN